MSASVNMFSHVVSGGKKFTYSLKKNAHGGICGPETGGQAVSEHKLMAIQGINMCAGLLAICQLEPYLKKRGFT